jgi:hypothetical protein
LSTPQSTPHPQAERGLRALVISPDGGGVLTDLPVQPARAAREVGEIVGGNLEAIIVANADWLAYINEEGARLALLPNLQADAICRALGYHFQPGDYLIGPAVFLGRQGANETDVPEHVLGMAREAGVLAPATPEAR